MSLPISSLNNSDDPMPKKESKQDNIVDVLRTVTGAIATAAAFEAASRGLFGGMGWSGVIVPLVSALGLFIVSGYVAFSRVEVGSVLLTGSTNREWRFQKNIRLTGRAGTISMFAILLWLAWDTRPNFIAGEDSLDGFLCSADAGKPITNGTVEVLSRSGEAMSIAERLDDRGYFFSDLQRWALHPSALIFNGPECRKRQLITLAQASPGACLAIAEAPEVIRETAREWVLKCED